MLFFSKNKFKSHKLTEFQYLQKECSEILLKNPKSKRLIKLKKQLGLKLLELDSIYVAFDEDFNSNYPYIRTDGRIEVCTTLEKAIYLKDYLNKYSKGHISIKKILKNDIKQFFDYFQHIGIFVLKIDSLFDSVDLWFKDFYEFQDENQLEEKNRVMRAFFLRDLQYTNRALNIEENYEEEDFRNSLFEPTITMRYNSYRELGNGLIYAFTTIPYIYGITYYSEKAYEKAKNIFQNDLNNAYEVHNLINLRTVRKTNNNELLICAFTDLDNAETVRNNFANKGYNDSIIIITFDELVYYAKKCNGIILDMTTYNIELLEKDFEEIFKYREIDDTILLHK